MKPSTLLGLAALFLLPACAVDVPDEEPAASDEAELTSGNFTYYTIKRDERRCVSPMCGGFFVARVNKPTTRCADGSWKEACYVWELDLSALGVSTTVENELRGAPRLLVLRGSVAPKTFGHWGNLGRFAATEAWRAPVLGTPTGTFYRLTEEGSRHCFDGPCSTIDETKLNSTANAKKITPIVEVSAAPGTDEAKWGVLGDLRAHGFLAAGKNLPAAQGGGTTLWATQIYARVRGPIPAGGACNASSDACAAGTACCYPCGIAGCVNRCIEPEPTGRCPMFP
jgi:hypothetical protein